MGEGGWFPGATLLQERSESKAKGGACEESLEAPDSKLLEKVPFPQAFYSFGAGFKAKGRGKKDNQVHDFGGLAVPVDIPYEGPGERGISTGTARASTGFCMMGVSVSSKVRFGGSSPANSVSSRSRPKTSGSPSCRAERLIVPRSFLPSPFCRKRPMSEKTVFRTHPPMGMIRPFSSAIGMKRSGEIGTTSGPLKRIRASAQSSGPSSYR